MLLTCVVVFSRVEFHRRVCDSNGIRMFMHEGKTHIFFLVSRLVLN